MHVISTTPSYLSGIPYLHYTRSAGMYVCDLVCRLRLDGVCTAMLSICAYGCRGRGRARVGEGKGSGPTSFTRTTIVQLNFMFGAG